MRRMALEAYKRRRHPYANVIGIPYERPSQWSYWMANNAEIAFPRGSLEAVKEWLESGDGTVGVCLLCGKRIVSESDMIPATNRHRCATV